MSRTVTQLIVAGALGWLCLLPATASESVTLAWKPSPDPSVTTYKLYYGPASHTYTHSIACGNVSSATITGLVAGATYYFGARAGDAAGVESDLSNEAVYTVPATAVSTPPAWDPIAGLNLKQNAEGIRFQLSGLSPDGAGANRNLALTATSSHLSLIANPTVSHSGPGNAGSLTFRPAADASGSALRAVTASVGGQGSETMAQRFTVTVLAPAAARAVVNGKPKAMKVVAPVSASPAAVRLETARAANGLFSFQVAGDPSGEYVIQASADLVHWSSVQTNTAPFTFTDANAATLPRCLYRTLRRQSAN